MEVGAIALLVVLAGQPPVDAHAQGKAIVSTTLGAEGIAGDAGRHFMLADDPAEFAAQTVRLLRDEAARRELGLAARARAEERYAWSILGARLAGEYTRVIEEAKR